MQTRGFTDKNVRMHLGQQENLSISGSFFPSGLPDASDKSIKWDLRALVLPPVNLK